MGEPIKYKGWPKGMDNRREEFGLPDGVLRDGLNVDVLSSSKVRMRYGPGTQTFAETNAHSVFSDKKKLLWATPSTLRTASIGAVPRTLLTDTRLAKPLSWVALHGRSFFSNEDVNGLVNVLGAYEPWGIVPPSVAPTLAGDGGIRIVQVTCTFLVSTIAMDGSTVLEESGAPIANSVATSDTGTVSLSSIPQSTDARFAGVRLYATGLNGPELFQAADLPVGVTTWGLRAPFVKGKELKTMLCAGMPPGQLIEYHNGAMYVAVGNVIYPSEPLRYTLYDNDKRFQMLPERVTLLKAVPQGASRMERPGIFVSADHTYFWEDGGTKDGQLRRVLDYKAIEGAAIHLPESNDVMWLSERGFVRGSSGGKVVNLTEGQIALDDYTRAAMGMLERNGHRSVIAIGETSTAKPLLSTDWVADELEREQQVE